ncbi:uncharacterized protein L3040_002154 [Drepanopeziza brunnea f. sp. 'multigermtubi']|uniref:Myb-like domain-containing protein n=1 Tax=Marssonina brunnea f. sp. multigermtubi (strain MB_m1) TaxID=1072389 RepID=K1WJF2_MARBU|nr:uncharacterized protein MBM_04154 [Drepanopeziza brunnea f. sp. 'multigermtubi' MB_m1]EKD17785.1 hypothetical protein MBM_04154 [Drepanopeziza brunnea f. sp. 'multigermtubi' MB_m1]KAJ5052404.1 hypothetical protein L3040_002154 [Drepanopeziza brunnea f. sp. 'multigermtubi']
MDRDELDDPGHYALEESSGSAYIGSENDDNSNSSHDEDEVAASRAGSARGRSRSRSIANKKPATKQRAATESDPEGEQEDPNLQDASAWAANFKEPNVEDIKTPPRGSRVPKRKAQKPAPNARMNLLKGFYNNNYRELLNSEIQDAVSRAGPSSKLEESQIGSSVWTKHEKALFFASLDRLGKNDTPGIAEWTGSKSQHEVQEYINLLHQGSMERRAQGRKLVLSTGLPAAMEVSDECAALLERAGDALATIQELAEQKVEKGKWGESWLITEDVALAIEKRRKDAAGEEAMREVLPAANLLDFRKWLELSSRVFMNSAAPREEDNWENIAEPGEKPAVRATAFEDFHSLAVNITKRLVATVLFCTQSRLRAKGSNLVKHSEINADDVEAALKILGMKANSHEFWIGCAKRCNVKIDDGGSTLTYEEVEEALRGDLPERARSRSRSLDPRTFPRTQDNLSSPSELDSELLDSDEEYMSTPPRATSCSGDDSGPSKRRKLDPAEVEEMAGDAQDVYTEAFDMHASQAEEIRLWDLLEQTAPFEFNAKPAGGPPPKGFKDGLIEREDWRSHVRYVAEWEMLGTAVTEEEFERNRKRKSRVAKGRVGKKLSRSDGDLRARAARGRASSEKPADRGVPQELDDEQDGLPSFEEQEQDAEDRLEAESSRAGRSPEAFSSSHRSVSRDDGYSRAGQTQQTKEQPSPNSSDEEDRYQSIESK